MSFLDSIFGSDDDEADDVDPNLEWPSVEEEYQLIKEIGHGAFATVYQAYCGLNNVLA